MVLQGKRACDTHEVKFPAISNQPALLHLILVLLEETTLAG